MFPVQVEFHRDELLVSYAARTARANGLLGVEDLFKDLEITSQAFHAGNAGAVKRFAVVAGIDPERARAQTFHAIADDRFTIADELLSDKHLLRRQFRVCPACLREDIGPELTRETALRAYARILWSLTPVHSCPIHLLLLVLPPEPGTNFDFSHGWEPWLFELFEGDLDKPTQAEGNFEAFAAAVLNGENPPKPGYLARLDLGAIGAAAEAMGLSLIHGAKWSKTELSAEDAAVASDVGFKVLSGGEPGVQSLLDELRFSKGKPQERPPGRYGKLYEWLLRGGGAGAEFAPLQDHLARHIQDTWPLGPKDICFRSKVTVRRFHSILTAAAQYGLRPGQVQDLLNGAGMQGALPLPEYEQIYDARAVEEVLDRVSSSVSMQAALKLLGLTRNQMATLIEAGFLTVSKGGDKARPRFSQADISAFIDRHRGFAFRKAREEDLDEVGILIAARRHGVSTAQIYGMLLEGKLSHVSRARDDLLWSSLRVSASEVGVLLSANRVPDDRIRLSTAAETLGLSNDFLRCLSREGWFDLQKEVDPRTRQPVTTIALTDIAAFQGRYITRRRLAREMMLDVRNAQHRLEEAGITPVVVSEDGRELIFHLEDCRHFLPDW